jgi:hypothetical protein
MRDLGRQTQDSIAKSSAIAEEACASMHTGSHPYWRLSEDSVRCFAAEKPEMSRFHTTMVHFYDIQKKEAYAYFG